jgi:hypothetical protein
MLHSACDVEGHIGSDSRFYLLDFSRVMPPDEPDDTVNSHLFKLLRPELAKRFTAPLCSDAFSGFVKTFPEMAVHNQEIARASEFLRRTVIPKFALEFTKKLEVRSAASVQFSRADLAKRASANSDTYVHLLRTMRLSEQMHRYGINMRYLPEVMRVISLTKVRGDASASSSLDEDSVSGAIAHDAQILLLIEMLARTIKSNLRGILRGQMRALATAVTSHFGCVAFAESIR